MDAHTISSRNPTNETVAAPVVAVDETSTHQRHPSLDMESLLRQWGGSNIETNDIIDESPSLTNSAVAVAGLPIPSANNEGIPHPFLGRSQSTTPNAEPSNTNVDNSRSHRRIASTGGDRLLPSLPARLLNPSVHEHEEGPAGEELHSAARITDWELVASLSKSKKGKTLAKYRGPDGWTALHHACSRRCPHANVIEVLLRAYPLALVCVDDRGWTPLHHACRFKAPYEVVRLLLRANSALGSRSAKIRCSQGRSALYYAMRYEAPSGVVELLLAADPAAVLDEDRDGICPLSLVWDDYANSFGGKRDLKALLKKFEGDGEHHVGRQDDAEDLRKEELILAEKRTREALTKDTPALRLLQFKWRVVNNLLRAYFHFPIQSLDADFEMMESKNDDGTRQRKWRILHAVSAVKCHHTLFLLARALYPEQARELDENDLLVMSRNSYDKPQSSSEHKQTISNRTALHFAATSPLPGRDGRNIIKILLTLNPDAPRHIDGYGSLPLHLLAENEHKSHWVQDGFRDVYNAYKEATSSKDGLGRTPLHSATSCSGRYSNSTTSHQQSDPSEDAPTPHNAPRDFNNASRNIESVILNLVIVNPNAASIADNTGRLPLHYIAERGEEWNNDANSTLAAYPAASRTRAGAAANNQLPLHMAASNPDACPSLIMNIVDANPRAASLTDGTGRLPLHMACDSGRSTWDRGIQSIYNAYHAAISAVEESPRKWTVLHTSAASHSAGHDLIENVLNLNPAAASIADGEGRYPLHLACAAGRHWEKGGLRMLFEADPYAALTEDRYGFLPLHIVAMKKPHCLDDNRLAYVEMGGRDSNDEEVKANEEEDLASMEVLFNLLTAQPSTVHLR